jgi:hypothetical protein
VLAQQTALPTSAVVVKVSSALRDVEIRNGVKAKFGGMRACYEDLLKTTPHATGSLKLHFEVRPDGRVESPSATMDGALEDAAFRTCALGVARTFIFAAPGAKTSVTYPVMFTPGSD